MPPVSDALNSSSQFGPVVFIFMALLIAAGLYIRYVSVPQRLATEANTAELTKAVVALTKVAETTHAVVTETSAVVRDVGPVVNAIAVAKVSELEAIAKIAKKTGTDVQKELAEAAGVMRFARHEYVTNFDKT
jgi:hypothetical protein